MQIDCSLDSRQEYRARFLLMTNWPKKYRESFLFTKILLKFNQSISIVMLKR